MRSLNRRSFISLSLASVASLALAGCGGQSSAGGEQKSEQGSSNDEKQKSNEEPGKIVSGVLVTPYDEGYDKGMHHATIEVENYGTIKLELNATNAPITVSNFAHLANQGFYDGLLFHRIIKGFMVQGGDPKGDGTGGSDPKIKGEFSENGIVNAIRHKRGVISMARSSENDSGSSQFFIMHAENSSLDGKYAAFGKVTEGIEVVDALAEVPVTDENGAVAPENKPKIVSIKMVD